LKISPIFDAPFERARTHKMMNMMYADFNEEMRTKEARNSASVLTTVESQFSKELLQPIKSRHQLVKFARFLILKHG
jgi:23S rRNA G2445 N2-methylase RlmL